jgi:hypothetical protein
VRADNAEPGFHALAINCTLIVIQRGLLHACPQERRVHLHSRAGDFAKHLTNHDIDIVARMLLHELTQWRVVMFSVRSAFIAAIVLTSSWLAAGAAVATPFIDVRSFWSVGPVWDQTIPSEIALSCYGDAVATGDSCLGTLSLNQDITTTSHFALNAAGGLVITNLSDAQLDGELYFHSAFSAFNSGGPGIGIAIDDPLTQAASFSSSFDGPFVGDWHSCSVGFLGYSGNVFSPTACGVPSPDSSEYVHFVLLSSLGPYESLSLSFSLNLTADFVFTDPPQGVPEPASGLIVIAGLGLIAWRRYRRGSSGGFC